MSEFKPAHSALEGAVDKATDSLRPVLESLMTGVHEAVESLADVASRAVKSAEQSGEFLKDSQTRVAGNCRSYVRAKPLTAIGVAVASGFLLSWALRQR